MATLTVYSTSADGDIKSSDPIWSNARAGTGTIVARDSSSNEVGQINLTEYEVYQAFISFDTSSIPVGSTINSAAVEVEVTTKNFSPSCTDVLNTYSYDWGASVTTADFVAGASLSSLYQVDQYGMCNIFALPLGWRSIVYDTVNADNWVVAGGTTKLLLASDQQENNIPLSSSSSNTFEFAEGNGSSTGARLTVDYTPSGASPATDGGLMGANF